MTAIRVLHIMHTPGPGGTETVVLNLLSWLPKPHVVQAVACPDGPLAGSARLEGVPHYPVPFTLVRRSWRPERIWAAISHVPEVSRRLSEAMVDFQPDIVHAHAVKATVLARYVLGRSSPRKLVWQLHDYVPLGRGRRFWVGAARRSADAIAAVSHDVAETVLGPRSQAVVVHNAMPALSEPDADGARSLLESLGIPRSAPVIGYAGRLDQEKGVGGLLRSFATVRRAFPAAHLLIAGGSPFHRGGALEALRREVAELGLDQGVHLLGRLPDLAGFYTAITLFALPAPREPFGLVILEALAYGVPVVAFDNGGPREILSGFPDGLLVPGGDLEGFASACCLVLGDPTVGERVRIQGPRFVATHYSPDTQIRALSALYQSVLSR